MNILEVKGLKKGFGGVYALDGLSLAFVRGTVTSVVGPNGSGKTTLMNVISGMVPLDQGAVQIAGTSLKRIEPERAPSLGITRTFQDVRLFEQMTLLDNILIALTERGVLAALFERHGAAHLTRAEEVLRTVGLWEKRGALCENLSYGQRKLAEIGRAMAMDCDIILLDEPFAGLFKEMVKTVVGVIRKLREAGKTIILIEHNMDLIRELSDHLIVMDAGRLLAEGLPNEVLARKDVIEAYLGE